MTDDNTGLIPRRPEAEAIWHLLFDYIANEDGPDYNEANMETLCADVLPRVWDHVLYMERAAFAEDVGEELIRKTGRVEMLRLVSAMAWEFGATFFADSPMHRFAMKLQGLLNREGVEDRAVATSDDLRDNAQSLARAIRDLIFEQWAEQGEQLSDTEAGAYALEFLSRVFHPAYAPALRALAAGLMEGWTPEWESGAQE